MSRQRVFLEQPIPTSATKQTPSGNNFRVSDIVVTTADVEYEFRGYAENGDAVWKSKIDDAALALKKDKNPSETITAGESLSADSLAYLKSDGLYYKTDADSYVTTAGKILYIPTAISAPGTGTGYSGYDIPGTGLTIGACYYISATAGGYTVTEPSSAGQQSRCIGTAISATVIRFKPSDLILGY